MGQPCRFSCIEGISGPALYPAGNFDEAGGITANNIARWSRIQDEACPADFIGDGLFNFFDVSAFMTASIAGCP